MYIYMVTLIIFISLSRERDWYMKTSNQNQCFFQSEIYIEKKKMMPCSVDIMATIYIHIYICVYIYVCVCV